MKPIGWMSMYFLHSDFPGVASSYTDTRIVPRKRVEEEARK